MHRILFCVFCDSVILWPPLVPGTLIEQRKGADSCLPSSSVVLWCPPAGAYSTVGEWDAPRPSVEHGGRRFGGNKCSGSRNDAGKFESEASPIPRALLHLHVQARPNPCITHQGTGGCRVTYPRFCNT